MAADDPAWIRMTQEGSTLSVALGGDWRVDAVGRLLDQAQPLLDARSRRGSDENASATATLSGREITYMDSAGAWLLYHIVGRLKAQQIDATVTGLSSGDKLLFDRVSASAARIEVTDVPAPRNPLLVALGGLGELIISAGGRALELLSFFGLTMILLGRTLIRPWRLELTATIKYVERTGVDALPIVGLLSFLIGVVLAYMGAVQLSQFGAEIFTVNLVGVAILRELGVLITSILIAGRSGSAFTAQIGTMKVNQEIDAMQTIGLNPVEILVLPRLLGLMISLPLLTFYADMMGLAGGAVMSVLVLDISLNQFLDQLNSAIDLSTFLVGLVKAPVFAYLIALVGCYEGLKVTGSAESVGLRTTMAVVEAIFLVIVVDAIFAIAFSYLRI